MSKKNQQKGKVKNLVVNPEVLLGGISEENMEKAKAEMRRRGIDIPEEVENITVDEVKEKLKEKLSNNPDTSDEIIVDDNKTDADKLEEEIEEEIEPKTILKGIPYYEKVYLPSLKKE